MNRMPLYYDTVHILEDAYFNDTLEHNNCYACAVGNLIAAKSGYKFMPCIRGTMGGIHKIVWDVCKGQYYDTDKATWFDGQDNEQIRLTGYAFKEAWQIEYAFEKAAKGKSDEDWMFNGLVAVLDKLKEIHEIEDNEPEVVRFTTHYKAKQLV